MLYNLLQVFDEWLAEHGSYSLLQVLYQLEFRAFFSVVLSFLIVLCCGPRTIRWLVRQKIGDSPEFYRQDINEKMKDKANTPTMGGLLICSSLLVTILLMADLSNSYIRLALLVTVWLAGVGAIDDWLKLTSARRAPGSREGLLAWEKLLFQLGIGLLCGWTLYDLGIGNDAAHSLTLPFLRTYIPGTEGLELEPSIIILPFLVFIGIAVLFVAGTSNAVNVTDGMDGLAAGLSMIAAVAFMLLCYIAGSPERAQYMLFPFVDGTGELMVVAGSIAGACLGFLWFNCAKARVFMGDTGSLPLGGLLACIAVAIRQEVLLVIIGGVFFVELGSSAMQIGWYKFTKGKRIFRCAPIHHHFHVGGWSENQIVVRFWIIAVVLVGTAMLLLKLR
ncbi:MAG: phospho-N-acetylmuramoyl-pentapeptide-transferase [Phycisphaerae bacterium]|nr:phospho-N-acetylmuramoyl-pentapeptide-transferase [Phycisphaerae bacterium]